MILVCSLFLLAQNGLKLNQLFSDNMVLQRDLADPVFGTATPGTQITVGINGQTASADAGPDGRWIARLRPMRAGGPYTLKVSGDGTATVSNVLVGEVWVASGQSNMQFTENGANDFGKAQAEANPNIRMFTVPDVSLETPAGDVDGSWIAASKDSVGNFSAVGYAFAAELQRRLNVPVGIVHTSWGGTPAEAWTSRERLSASPDLKYMVDNYLAGLATYDERKAAYDKQAADYNAQRVDNTNNGFENGWASTNFDASSWKTVQVPSLLSAIEGKEVDGAFWFRRTFAIPQEWAGKDLKLELGPVDDYDRTYVNGSQVGATASEVPNWWAVPRIYTISAGVVHPGDNVIAVRVFNVTGPGGITGSQDQLRVSPTDGTGTAVPLAGSWSYKAERLLIDNPPAAPMGPGNSWAPGGLYNGMIAPLIPYGIRGAIWYQGESNAGRAFQYRELFPTMIRDWRERWGEGDFPFYFVQLANYMERRDQPDDSAWAELREAQTMTLCLRKAGMATIIDIGEANDIHPKNKREVGRRLALIALANSYDKKIDYSGPSYRSMRPAGHAQIRVLFDFGSGLKTTDARPPVGFAIAGEDHKFVWADAKIDGTTILLSSPSVPKPVAVRYAWADNPATNLVNGDDLPAVPFRTDDWPGITVNNK